MHLVSQARLSHTERESGTYRWSFDSAEPATQSIFIVRGLLEINVLIDPPLHEKLARINCSRINFKQTAHYEHTQLPNRGLG